MLAGLAAVAAAAIVTPWLATWVPANGLVDLSAFVLAVMLTASLREQERARADRAMMPPAFVVIFAALMLLGGGAATMEHNPIHVYQEAASRGGQTLKLGENLMVGIFFHLARAREQAIRENRASL